MPAPDRPLDGTRILLTRARADSAGLRFSLENLGATVLELPTVEIVPPLDPGSLDAALRDLSRFDWLAFTSRNAVRAVFDRLTALGLSLSLPPALHIAAVGPSTQAELEAVGVRVDCVPPEATSTALGAEMALRGVRDARVLLPVGDLARPELENTLQRAGYRVHRVVAYRTVRPADVDAAALEALRQGGIDVLAVASPSAIRNLAELLRADDGDRLEDLREVRIACIGPSTAAAVRDLLLEPAVVAREHTIDGLVGAIVELCSRENIVGPS